MNRFIPRVERFETRNMPSGTTVPLSAPWMIGHESQQAIIRLLDEKETTEQPVRSYRVPVAGVDHAIDRLMAEHARLYVLPVFAEVEYEAETHELTVNVEER